MIIPNGYIRITTSSGGGMRDGIPVRATSATCDPIAANIVEARRSHGLAGEQTAATSASYSILVDRTEAAAVSDSDKVEVLDSRGVSLGVFQVQSAQLLSFVDAVKIMV